MCIISSRRHIVWFTLSAIAFGVESKYLRSDTGPPARVCSVTVLLQAKKTLLARLKDDSRYPHIRDFLDTLYDLVFVALLSFCAGQLPLQLSPILLTKLATSK